MSGLSSNQCFDRDQKIRAQESQVSENLATIRMLEEQWEEYRQVMRSNTARFEEAGIGMGAKNYFVQKELAVSSELDRFVGRLADEQAELLAETAQEIRLTAEAESERLRRETAGE